MKDEFKRILGLLESAGIEHELVEHEPVFTSEQASKVRGVPLEWGVKAMLLKGKGFFLVLIRADKKVDFKFFRNLESTNKIRLATPEEVLEQTNCEVGSVPPLGFSKQLKTYMDKELLDQEKVTFNAGLLDKSVIMPGKDLKKVIKDPIVF